jgi:pimeloyl-ACP methyl ester carboxylesterase
MKTSIILLHGALGASVQLQRLADNLNTTFDVHLLNFSGHGGKPFEKDFNVAQFANELKNYLDAFPQKQFCVFGYSMGGYVALYLESKYPRSISSIFTLATKFDWNPDSSAKEAAMLNPEKLLEKVPAFSAELEKRHAPNNWKTLLQKTAEMMVEMGDNPPLSSNSFKQITLPVLLGRGDLDKMVSKEETMQVVNSLPNGFFKNYDNWQHPIEKVDIEILAAEIRQFFQ